MQKVSQVVFYFKIRNFERFSLTRRCLLYNYKKLEIRLLSLTVSCWLVFSKVFSDSMWFGDGSELDLLITIWTDSSNFLRKKTGRQTKSPHTNFGNSSDMFMHQIFHPTSSPPKSHHIFQRIGLFSCLRVSFFNKVVDQDQSRGTAKAINVLRKCCSGKPLQPLENRQGWVGAKEILRFLRGLKSEHWG